MYKVDQNRKKGPVLFVDDEIAALDSYRELLKGHFDVITTQTVEEALKILASGEIPVVVADYKMAPINGIEFLKKVEADYPETIRILFTAYKTEPLLEQAINEGHVYGYFQKPLHQRLKSFISYMHQVLEVYDLRAEVRREKEKLQAKVEAQMRQLIQQDKMAAIGMLMGGIMHEVRNPIGAALDCLGPFREKVQAFWPLVEAMQKEKGKEGLEAQFGFPIDQYREEVDSLLELYDECLRRAVRVTNQTGEFAHASVEARPFEVLHAIEVTYGVLKYELDIAKVEVVQDYEEEEYYAFGRSDEIKQVLMNLLVNAKDAIEEKREKGGDELWWGKIWVKVRYEGGEEWVKIQVRDNGNGIPKQYRERVFQTFFTTKPEGKGTGLGLGISKEIIEERHGGKMTVESTVGEGTTFTILLPTPGKKYKERKMEKEKS